MKPLFGRCILTVDSEPACLTRWREQLLVQGARVICSASIDSAIANAITFPSGTFDAAVIEHRSGGLDAVAVVEVLRALPGTCMLPLLVLADTEEVEKLQRRICAPHVVLARSLDQRAVVRLGSMFAAVRTPGSVVLPLPAQGSRGRILIAEDDPVNAATLQAMLVQLGFSVVRAGNGEEAVARAATDTFDIILMDGQMPVLDGLEATGIIRDDEARRGLRRPIIGVTASMLDEYRDRCIDAGMDDVIHKPVVMSGLVRVLARWLPDAAGAAAALPSNVMTFTPADRAGPPAALALAPGEVFSATK